MSHFSVSDVDNSRNLWKCDIVYWFTSHDSPLSIHLKSYVEYTSFGRQIASLNFLFHEIQSVYDLVDTLLACDACVLSFSHQYNTYVVCIKCSLISLTLQKVIDQWRWHRCKSKVSDMENFIWIQLFNKCFIRQSCWSK